MPILDVKFVLRKEKWQHSQNLNLNPSYVLGSLPKWWKDELTWMIPYVVSFIHYETSIKLV